ncbi:acyltransferase [Mucilaginibacter robiniae]|uniref:Acyltransferase n=1 Tax=Mucilaginibacter robiniae TaxID=2728022 RepID=A0A7L5DWI1_9SPHI|nr:acyltransferase [Mucilaginibacter robiniae]QJD94427.1 acyltransferase [Mucilaginibacter robiniae]
MQYNAQPATKPHYPILDGLRGVAAITVVAFHIFETHSTSHLDQVINHGYLAVDFFFLLSGFVIGYAYDDRWHKLTIGDFFKRRLARLQPMVIIGMIIGAALFYFQGCELWPGIQHTPVWKTLLVMLVGCTLIPLPISADIRGWQEMHPLNGPGWSLFFEYIANILYALFIRKFSKTALTILVVIAGIALVEYAVNSKTGDVIGGWSVNAEQLRIGFTRLTFPFFAGLLLSRTAHLTRINHAFLWCSILLLIVLIMPRIGGAKNLWANGLYDSLSIILMFPLIVYLGASGDVTGKFSSKLCKFLGDVSYPIYITHYPLIYTYTAWVSWHHGIKFQQAWPVAILTIVSAILLAYACLKWYDEPVRRWLRKKFAI